MGLILSLSESKTRCYLDSDEQKTYYMFHIDHFHHHIKSVFFHRAFIDNNVAFTKGKQILVYGELLSINCYRLCLARIMVNRKACKKYPITELFLLSIF